ncbi:cytochrome d ubiquinol oxidase subunit II [Thermomonospora echinospora]|uniref:Cytochrome d ubiquinol oxidase subunit II n=1 Tax=Thermomonospora echinospora TaxID=1992 RepID=A0A1H6DKK6_9ACTN|nr:cytochrome d ubiquinol oxidase subunit II [Thermomonospora echinospora]SEG85870.1 cytochrome d ubiquinol oxidase subunit II [Thermomonospora echinospora]
MSYPDIALGLILVGLSAYLLFGGADFGAGLWHLLSRRPSWRQDREVIEHAMGPLWEANHVWLIFAMVMTWTAFPPVFAEIMSTHWIPLSLAALGIVARGSSFVFAKAASDAVYPWVFGISSIVTPYCMGAVAAVIATGGSSWLSPAGVYGGLLTTGLCAYLAAVYLTWDGRRLGAAGPALRFRGYALISGAVVGLLALPGALTLGVLSPLITLSALAGVVSLALLVFRRYLAVRVTAALAAATVLWGAAGLADLDLDAAAAHDAVLQVVFVALGVGALILVPSMTWLFILFQRAPKQPVT